MTKMLATLLFLTLALSSACKKGDATAPDEGVAADAEQPPKLGRSEQVAAVLEGSPPQQNLNTIMSATLVQLELATDADHAAQILDNMLYQYNIAELRKQAKLQEKSGRGPTASERKQWEELRQRYETQKAKFAAENVGTFRLISQAWDKVWGFDAEQPSPPKTEMQE